jgi:hypothetical protein
VAHEIVDSVFELFEVIGVLDFEGGDLFDEGVRELELELELFVGPIELLQVLGGDIDEGYDVCEWCGEGYIYPELLQYLDDDGVFAY